MTTNIDKEIKKLKQWTALTPTPAMLYLEEYDETLVVWDGFVMNKTVALSLALEVYHKFPTPEMKACLHKRYMQLYITGFFGSDISIMGDLAKDSELFFGYLRRTVFKHIHKTCKGRPISEVLGWFKD